LLEGLGMVGEPYEVSHLVDVSTPNVSSHLHLFEGVHWYRELEIACIGKDSLPRHGETVLGEDIDSALGSFTGELGMSRVSSGCLFWT
jgi:hypothetical protein